jgi:TonB family protein
MTPRRLQTIAVLSLGLCLACAAPTPTDDAVVRGYRMFGWGRCDDVRQQAHEIDFSGDGARREPFFRLLDAYCLELAGESDSAKALYSSIIERAPQTTQAFEAALRLRDIERLERLGLTREEQKKEWQTRHYEKSARPIQRIDPKYPSAIVAAKIRGWVLVDFGISSDGSVVDPVVIDSDPPFIFDGAALAAMRHWVYEPSSNSELTRAAVRLNFDIQ